MVEIPTAPDVARKLADAMEDASIPYAIGGAIAYGLHAPPRATNDEQVVDVFAVFVGGWQGNIRSSEELPVAGCDSAASVVPIVQVTQLDPQHGRLNVVQPAVPPTDPWKGPRALRPPARPPGPQRPQRPPPPPSPP